MIDFCYPYDDGTVLFEVWRLIPCSYCQFSILQDGFYIVPCEVCLSLYLTVLEEIGYMWQTLRARSESHISSTNAVFIKLNYRYYRI